MRRWHSTLIIPLFAVLLGFTTPIEEGREVDRDRVIHLLQRATYGARPQDIAEVERLGIEGWLDRQLNPRRIENPAQEVIEDRFPVSHMTIDELMGQYPPAQALRPLRERVQDESLPEEERQALRRELRSRSSNQILSQLTGAHLYRAAYSERQLEEVMTAFWFDHFNVFYGKNATRYMIADYEANAIRPHVFGKFEDILLATASHPAMLFYLDNWRSASPDVEAIRAQGDEQRERLERTLETASRSNRQRTRIGGAGELGARGRVDPRRQQDEIRRRLAELDRQVEERIARLPGLNENYARELLELHTVGVDAGYTQDDIIEVARAFTGWTLQQPGRARVGQQRPGGRGGRTMDEEGMMDERSMFLDDPLQMLDELEYDGAYEFYFRPELHDGGEKTVLGHTIEAGGGQADGLQVLHIVATHPATARFIATQLATRFVADIPPETLIDRLAQVFTETDGDLREVTRALLLSPEFNDPQYFQSRIKSPVTLVASTLRLTDSDLINPAPLIQLLRSLENAPYQAEAPTGYEEVSAGWATSGAMVNRMNFGLDFASGGLRATRPNSRALGSQARAAADDILEGLTAVLLPGVDSAELQSVIREDLEENPPEDLREANLRIVGLILGSPEFQRH